MKENIWMSFKTVISTVMTAGLMMSAAPGHLSQEHLHLPALTPFFSL